jgi:IclR family acetate operon transcriptional repressor
MRTLTVQEALNDDAHAASATSVDKALRLLVLLSEKQFLTVSSAADHLGVARSTAHRLLGVLQKHGFAFQDVASRAYGPGSALLRVGLTAVESLELRAVARPEIEALAIEVGETVHLITYEGSRTFVLDSVESQEAVRVSSRIGGSMPVHTTAAGKALLAQLPPEQVAAIVGPDPLPTRTARSISTYTVLAAQLDEVRRRGYAINDAENEPDIVAVAVAIPGVHGVRSAAVSAAAPANRVDEDRLVEIAAATMATAKRIGVLLGGRA